MSKTIWSRTENHGAPRLGFDAYNISRERYVELRNGCVAGKYSRETLSKACGEFKFIEPWIILSVTKNKSYDAMQVLWELGEIDRPAVGRSNFYGFRRRFFANLDKELKERGANMWDIK